MAYTSTVEFVWLPAATSPGPVLPPLASRFPTASSADAAIHRSSGLRNLWRERFEGTSGGKVDCVAALATTGGAVPPGFLCRILGSRRALAQARTKSEPLLARLRCSWHICLQWNSCGCRRRVRRGPAPPSKNPVPSEAAHALPSLHRACHATSRFALFLPRLLLFATF